MIYSDSDYFYERNSTNMSQTTINIIIIIILITIFYFLFNFGSINYFSNLNNTSNDDAINNLKNELAFVKEELNYKNYQEEKPKVFVEEKPKVFIEEKPKVYKDDYLYNTSDPNMLIQSIAPIIYDPIENYDRLKLLDPLVDPRGRSSADQIPTPQVAAQLNFPTQGILDRYHRVGLLIAINKHECKKNRRRNNYENFDSTDGDSYEGFSNIETDTYDNNSTDSYEDFGNIEKVVKGKKVNVDSDSSTFNYKNSIDKKGRISRYRDNSSDLQTLSSSYNSKFKDKIIPNNIVLDIGDRDNDILELIGKKIAHDWYRYFTSISKGNKIIKINVHNRNRKELYDGDVVYIPILKRHYKVKIDKLDMIEYNPYFF